MPGRISSPVFAGRAQELAQLDAAFEAAADGRAAAVLVGGEAGVGKTRLLDELASRVRRAGGVVLEGRCVDLRDAAIPLLPIAEALEPVGPVLAASKASAFAPVLERLKEASVSAPVLFAIDDLQWADRTTIDVLTYLMARLRSERVLLVITHRAEDVDRSETLRSFLVEASRRPLARRMQLARLTREEAATQLAGILGAEPAPAVIDAIFARSDGNPLYTEELVGAVAGGALPPTLLDMLVARIAALPSPAQELVRAAAVGGRRIHHLVLADISRQAGPQITASIRAAVAGHVLVAEGDELVFRHPLLREAAYSQLLPGERAGLHAACARALEAHRELADATPAALAAELAHHWLRAGDRQRAFEAAVRAGREAEKVPAPAEAAKHFARALERWDDVERAERHAGMDRIELLARAAETTAMSGAPGRAGELVAQAIAMAAAQGDVVRAGALHGRHGWYCCLDSRQADGLDEYEQAIRLLPPQPASPERAEALAVSAFLLLLHGRHEEARERCVEALAAARACGARAAEARALIAQALHQHMRGDPAGAIDDLRRALPLARASGDADAAGRAGAALSNCLRMTGRLEEALEVALESAELSRVSGHDLVHGDISTVNAAEAAFELGRWQLTESLAREVLSAGGARLTRGFAHHLLGLVAIGRGRFAAAADHIAGQRAECPQPDAEAKCYMLELDALLAIWSGRPDVAAQRAEDARRTVGEDFRDFVARILAIGVRAEANRAERARAKGDRDGAEAAGERARRFCEQARAWAGPDPALHASLEAECARAENRCEPEHWEAVVRVYDERRSPFAAAYARWRFAEVALTSPGGRSAAAEALRAAHAMADRIGAGPLLAEIEALGRRARIDLAPDGEVASDARKELPAPARELGLTARELEVLEHVAMGQTNREIGADLFISSRTAGVHVSHILEKLGASTRTEAAAAAHRLGLVS